MKTRLLVPLSLLLLGQSTITRAQWVLDGIAVSTADYSQPVKTLPDGAGGAIVVWSDDRGSGFDVYAQRIDASGVVQWMVNGVSLCSAAGDQNVETAVSDGAGGAVVCWTDFRTGIPDIYAQRINVSGTVLWTTNGVPVTTAPGNQYAPIMIAADGTGGAIIAWEQNNGGLAGAEIYAQRIDGTGAVKWAVNGIAVCALDGSQAGPVAVSDGANGAIVAWSDYRSGSSFDVYAQRVDGLGVAQWTANGIAMCDASGHQSGTRLCADGAGGAIVAWRDQRGASADIYAQRVDAAGNPAWTANGVPVVTASGDQEDYQLETDGAGGTIITWSDKRIVGNADIFAQRVGSAGAPLWTIDGVSLCAVSGNQELPAITTDGAGGAVVAWQDLRAGATNANVYAQRVDGSGAVTWTADGVPVCTAAQHQFAPRIAATGDGGVILAWTDFRGVLNAYAQRIRLTDGAWGYEAPTGIGDSPALSALVVLPNHPNPYSGETMLEVGLPAASEVSVEVYDVTGRRVRDVSFAHQAKGWSTLHLDSRDGNGALLPSGVYFYRVRAGNSAVTRKMVITR